MIYKQTEDVIKHRWINFHPNKFAFNISKILTFNITRLFVKYGWIRFKMSQSILTKPIVLLKTFRTIYWTYFSDPRKSFAPFIYLSWINMFRKSWSISNKYTVHNYDDQSFASKSIVVGFRNYILVNYFFCLLPIYV